MRVAVFGASGLVGGAVVETLRNDPDKRVDAVIGLDRHLPVHPQPHVDWRRIYVDRDDIGAHLHGVDAVVGLTHGRRAAGLSGMRRLLLAVADAGIAHLVYASSFLVYSPVEPLHDPIPEEWPADGLAPALAVKTRVAAERLLREFAAEHPVMRVAWIRPGLPLGPDVFGYLAERVGPLAGVVRGLRHLPVLVGVDGATVPVVHHDDVGAAYRLAVTGSGSGPYNVALDTPLNLSDAARALGARPVALPAAFVARAQSLAERGASRHGRGGWLAIATRAHALDTRRARQELGWAPVHTLDDAVRSTVAGHEEVA